MPSAAHETLAAALREDPHLLPTLLDALGLPSPSQPLAGVDSTVRWMDPVEVRPDGLSSTGAEGWFATEVQCERDDDKARRWPLLAAVLLDEHRTMGDIVVLTHRRSIGAWARTVAMHRGPLGTRLTVEPVVVLVTDDEVERLLDPAHPKLALVAAWAMHERHGASAQQVVRRALDLARELEEPRRTELVNGILNVLGERMRAMVEADEMDFTKLPEGPLVKLLKAEGRAEGRVEGRAEHARNAVLKLATRRALVVTDTDRARIEAETDLAVLDAWLERVLDATSMAGVFGNGN
jgi:hypothetical protein